jgi:hypothetical protein
MPSDRREAMSACVPSSVLPPYGSRCAATFTAFARAARMIAGRRASSAEPLPHHETTTSPIPARAISRSCARTIAVSLDEYAPRAG